MVRPSGAPAVPCAAGGQGAAGTGRAGAALAELLPGAAGDAAGQGGDLEVVVEKLLLWLFALFRRGVVRDREKLKLL